MVRVGSFSSLARQKGTSVLGNVSNNNTRARPPLRLCRHRCDDLFLTQHDKRAGRLAKVFGMQSLGLFGVCEIGSLRFLDLWVQGVRLKGFKV